MSRRNIINFVAMKKIYLVACSILLCCTLNAQTSVSNLQNDSLSSTLLLKINNLISPFLVTYIYWIDSVPLSSDILEQASFMKYCNGKNNRKDKNSRSGFFKSKSSNVNIFYYAKVSERVDIYTIKPDMTLVDFLGLEENPDQNLNPTKILSLIGPSEDQNNAICFNEIMFYLTNEHFKIQNNKWIKLQ